MNGFQPMSLVRKCFTMAIYFVSSLNVHVSTQIRTTHLLLAALSFALRQMRLPPSPSEFSSNQLLRVESLFRKISPKS